MSSFCKLYRLYRCSNGRGFLLYVRKDIPSRLLTEYKLPENAKCLFRDIQLLRYHKMSRSWALSIKILTE